MTDERNQTDDNVDVAVETQDVASLLLALARAGGDRNRIEALRRIRAMSATAANRT